MRWFYLLLALTLTACAGSKPMTQDLGGQVPCAQVQTAPPYQAWGYETPNDWACFYVPSDSAVKDSEGSPYYSWRTDGKEIRIFHAPIARVFSGVNLPKEQQPQATIRYLMESFLGDETVLQNDKAVSNEARLMLPNPKGVFFSRNNEKVVAYNNSGVPQRRGAKDKRMFQSAQIFSNTDKEMCLAFSCSGCTPDEFFSLVINPVIQK
jgi:hypothetical protein